MTSSALSTIDARNDPRGFRDALGRFATGVTVITTRSRSGRLEGLTANSFSALSLAPPMVVWSVRTAAPSAQTFRESSHFAVNVLSTEQHASSIHFATPQPNKFSEHPYVHGLGGCALLPGSLACFECVTESAIERGDHILIIGNVVRSGQRSGEPLLFVSGRYWRGGDGEALSASPKAASPAPRSASRTG